MVIEQRARRVHSFESLKQPGDYLLTSRIGTEATIGMMFRCPCGCNDYAGIHFDVPEAAGLPGPKWTWDGNEDCPTIDPSIRRVGSCGWHGWLKRGVFKTA